MTPLVAIKFCGMTRPQDVRAARDVGVDYVGCVFAGGPRQRTAAQAIQLWAALDGGARPRRVGVFAEADSGLLLNVAAAAVLDVVQLVVSAEATTALDLIGRAKERLGLEVWAVLRCRGMELPAVTAALWERADALVLDTHVDGVLGGTGVALPWSALAPQIEGLRRGSVSRGRLVLAGGLTADNVARAIELLRPDIVDVSSGIERSPGIKDHGRMRAFADAVGRADAAVRSSPSRSYPASP